MKALILTYYFPPCAATAGYRPFSWATHFKEYGIEPTVITRHWYNTENTRAAYADYEDGPIKIEKKEEYTSISLPYLPNYKRKIGEQWLNKLPLLRKFYYFFLTLAGQISIDMDARSAFRSFLKKHLKENRYDILIVTTPPFNLIRLAKELSAEYNIPYVVDFRDLWNNHEMKKGFRYKGTDKFLFRLMKKHIRDWISKADLVTVATQPMIKYIKQLGYSGNVEVLLNGYEDHLYNLNGGYRPLEKKLTIAYIGTLYLAQDVSIFIKGFSFFIKQNPEARIQLRFIGVGFDQQIEADLKKQLPEKYLFTSGRVPREAAIKETLQADILYHAAWKGFEGLVTTKIFDYLGAKKNILVAPGDDDSIDEFIIRTNAGKIANTPGEVAEFISQWYKEWEEKGKLSFNGDQELISNYSREKQTEKFSKLIKQIVIHK